MKNETPMKNTLRRLARTGFIVAVVLGGSWEAAIGDGPLDGATDVAVAKFRA